MSAVEGERGGDALLTNLSATFEQEAANTTTRTPTEGPPAAAEPALSPPAASAPPASERWAAIPSRIIRETIADLEKRAAQREGELQATQQLVESLRTTLRDEQQSRSGLVSQIISLEARVRTLDEQGDEGRLHLATVERERDRLAAQVLRMQEEAAARLHERNAGVLGSAAYQELNAKLRNAHEELDIVKLERDILERKLQAALNGQPPEILQAVGTEPQKENVEATLREARRAMTPLRPAAGANDASGRTPTVSRRSAFKPNRSLNESQEPSLVRQHIQAFDSKLLEAHEKKRVRGDRDIHSEHHPELDSVKYVWAAREGRGGSAGGAAVVRKAHVVAGRLKEELARWRQCLAGFGFVADRGSLNARTPYIETEGLIGARIASRRRGAVDPSTLLR
eukprot:ctg_2636.g587